MTKTDEPDLLEGLDFEAVCDYTNCEEVAEWGAVLKCCGSVLCLCNKHLKDALEWAASGGMHSCPQCGSNNIEGNPFLAVEKLKK